eukprot:1274789-Pyramimonas_sp.AAC.1
MHLLGLRTGRFECLRRAMSTVEDLCVRVHRVAARVVKQMYVWMVCAVRPAYASPCSAEGLQTQEITPDPQQMSILNAVAD